MKTALKPIPEESKTTTIRRWGVTPYVVQIVRANRKQPKASLAQRIPLLGSLAESSISHQILEVLFVHDFSIITMRLKRVLRPSDEIWQT